MGRIVLFGATGYTGRLVADALAGTAAEVTLAGRRPEPLEKLAAETGATSTLVADARDGSALRGALGVGDVLVSTVGPFVRLGGAALETALATGAHYLDSTGEPAFIRRVFDEGAEARGCLLTAFGYDYVPGNLAGALALAEAGGEAVAVEVGYFVTGRSRGLGLSTGTLASVATISTLPSHAHRGGALRQERMARRVGTYHVRGSLRSGISVGGTEHLSLPRLYPALQDVDVHLGWTGPWSRAVQGGAAVLHAVARIPGADRVLAAATAPLAARTGAGPEADERDRTGSLAVGRALDRDGSVVAEVELRGPNAYTFTGGILAWGASRLAADGARCTGAVGPAEAFGLDDLRAGCEQVGLTRTR